MNGSTHYSDPHRLLVVALSAATLLAPGCSTWWSEGRDQSAASVEVRRDSIEVAVPAKGYLEALNASPIAVPRVPTGALKVKELIEEGSLVEAGDIVVVFDDTQLRIDLSNHRATFSSTDRRIDSNELQSRIENGSIEVMREVAELERDHSDAFQLADETIYSRQEILETEVRRDNAQETIVFADASLLLRGEYYDIEERILGVERSQAEGKLGRVETSLANLVLKAPIGGLVLYKKNWRGGTVGVGDSLWPGNLLLSIVDPASVSLTAFVLERDAAGVQVGARARVRVDARPEREFSGRVETVAELSRPIESGSPVKYFELKIALEDADPLLLKPGMRGEAQVITGEVADALVIPRSAVHAEGKGFYVLVDNADSPERRDVRVGPGDQAQVVIEDGLTAGERVLVGEPPSTAPHGKGALTAAARGSEG